MAEAYTWFHVVDVTRPCLTIWQTAHADTAGVTNLARDGHIYQVGGAGTPSDFERALAIASRIEEQVSGTASTAAESSEADACASVERRENHAVLVEHFRDATTGATLYLQTIAGMGTGTGQVVTIATSPYFVRMEKAKQGPSLGDLLAKIRKHGAP
jgi:hypothetical protein